MGVMKALTTCGSKASIMNSTPRDPLWPCTSQHSYLETLFSRLNELRVRLSEAAIPPSFSSS
ncbi:hypothetical protein E2C01_003680 [Portunus trituberculatus]|uniref:Uncharacterized protein n=1 Tax=Portunus trituberculatus TaxID=210409 RepID=A0A5B7CN14_PORTR|nr:hypothetical protein [Portunus trituberculatus]